MHTAPPTPNTCFTDPLLLFVHRRNHRVTFDKGSSTLQHQPPDATINIARESSETPIVLLNGFGVGTFHNHRLMDNLLANEDQQRNVYCMDYIGQGRSSKTDNVDGVKYSVDEWADQVISFIEDIVLPSHNSHQKVHIVGHSVGGYLSVVLANKRPDLVDSICLLDPTPIWGLNLPGWDAQLPAPSFPKQVAHWALYLIANRAMIKTCLESAYASREAISSDLVDQILECAQGADSAFSSIMWSKPATFPSSSQDFYENLSNLSCDVLLMFGKDDPWCRPCFAKKMLGALSKRGSEQTQRYLELENVGHCPNHEAPQAVGHAIRSWVSSVSHKLNDLSLVNGDSQVFSEPWADIAIRELKQHEIPMNIIDHIATALV